MTGMTKSVNHHDAAAPVAGLPGGDVEWVTGLLDIYRAGDLEVAIKQLDDLLRLLRGAVKARRTLTTVPAETLGQGHAIRRERQGIGA